MSVFIPQHQVKAKRDTAEERGGGWRVADAECLGIARKEMYLPERELASHESGSMDVAYMHSLAYALLSHRDRSPNESGGYVRM